MFRAKDLIAVLMLIVLGVTHYWVPAPKAIEAAPYTEQQIREEVENEHREKAIHRAVVAARMVYGHNGCGKSYSDLTGRVAYEYGLSPRLLAAVVVVESCGRPTAISGKSSIGILQINPRVWHYSRGELLDPSLNMRIGAKILKGYITRYGVVEGLHAYNGFGNKTSSYSDRVLEVSNGKG